MKIRNMLMIVVASLSVAAQAQPMETTSKTAILDAISRQVKENAYVGGVDFSRWDEFVAKHKSEFAEANTHDTFARAVNGALNEFGFSHMQLLTPRSAQTRVTGTSVGIGILIEPVEDGIRVVRVLPGGPAEKAGLRVGDTIIRGDDVRVTGPEQLRGEKGTPVTIVIRRDDDTEKELTIVRDEFSLLLKDEMKWVDDKTVLIRINTFATGYETRAIDKFFEDAATAERMIIDLRSNGGGAVMNLSHLAGKVMPTSNPMGKFITRNHANEYARKYPGRSDEDPAAVAEEFGMRVMPAARRDSKPFEGEVVVLVNRASASASEIFAATIRDNKRGRVVGMTTAGAVLASTFRSLPEGWSIQLPLMEYVTPGGARLEGAGVRPDVEVDGTQVHDDDYMIKLAIETLDAIRKEGAAASRGGGR